jgi:phospholipid transport system transporter-binding protein
MAPEAMHSTANAQDSFVSEGEGRVRLQAPLRFATVPALRRRGLELIGAAAAQLTIDLSGVSSADSAGLALLIDWLARARAGNKTLRYVQPPEALRALARLSEVEALIMGQEPHAPVRTGN